MFCRVDQTYDITASVIDAILQDEANPLHQIIIYIPDKSVILDIGAGNGLLAKLFSKINKSIVIDGIEPNTYAFQQIEPLYRHLYNGYVEDFFEKIDLSEYDFIVLADVIEHIPNPLIFMEQLIGRLSPHCKILVSVPNISFGSVRLALMKGDFDYVDSGIIERTHLRFFTYNSITKLFLYLGLKIEKVFFLKRNFLKSGIPLRLADIDIISFVRLLKDENASVYQFLFVLSHTVQDVKIIKVGHSIRDLLSVPKLFQKVMRKFGTVQKG